MYIFICLVRVCVCVCCANVYNKRIIRAGWMRWEVRWAKGYIRKLGVYTVEYRRKGAIGSFSIRPAHKGERGLASPMTLDLHFFGSLDASVFLSLSFSFSNTLLHASFPISSPSPLVLLLLLLPHRLTFLYSLSHVLSVLLFLTLAFWPLKVPPFSHPSPCTTSTSPSSYVPTSSSFSLSCNLIFYFFLLDPRRSHTLPFCMQYACNPLEDSARLLIALSILADCCVYVCAKRFLSYFLRMFFYVLMGMAFQELFGK